MVRRSVRKPDRSSTDRSPAAVDIHVGARVRMRRRFLGLNQTALAEALGLTFQQVQKYERGANRVSASKLYDIARALHVSVSFFFEGLPDQSLSDEPDLTGQALHAFLTTPEGLELAEVFPRIHDARMRRQLLEFARAVTEREKAQS